MPQLYISRFSLAAIIPLVFSACTMQNAISTPVYIQLKTPSVNISDAGFYTHNQHKKELVVLAAGNSAFKLELDNQVCLNDHCTDKSSFIKDTLSPSLPSNIIDDILDKKELKLDARSSSVEKINDGFVQKFSDENYDITYSVTQKSVVFSEIKNKIYIKITELEK